MVRPEGSNLEEGGVVVVVVVWVGWGGGWGREDLHTTPPLPLRGDAK